jgi:heme oxygenase
MGSHQSVRAQLRAATADAHTRVDAAFSRFALASREDYARFLEAQGGALIPLERALDAGAAPALGIDWPARRRSAALLRDLAALGYPAPEAQELAPIDVPEAALGTIYVLEGSRLGGALLKRSVDAALPAEFLAPGAPGAWRALLDTLESALQSPAQVDAAIAAAGAAFDLFEASGTAAVAAVELR